MGRGSKQEVVNRSCLDARAVWRLVFVAHVVALSLQVGYEESEKTIFNDVDEATC